MVPVKKLIQKTMKDSKHSIEIQKGPITMLRYCQQFPKGCKTYIPSLSKMLGKRTTNEKVSEESKTTLCCLVDVVDT